MEIEPTNLGAERRVTAHGVLGLVEYIFRYNDDE